MSFHLYQIDEIYSNADGTVQFIELSVGPFNGESVWSGRSITVSSGGTVHTFTFPADLPSTLTANTSVLIATQGFANLGIVTPDYVVPAGFLFTGGGTINYAGVDSVTYAALPNDGTHSVDQAGSIMIASPTNFHGDTGQLPPTVNVINGTAGPDVLAGGPTDDVISGLGGNDLLSGGGGNDTLDGGTGIDTASLGVRLADVLGVQLSGTQIQGQQMLDHYAPGLSTPALVTHLFGTIAGITPTAEQVAEFSEQVGAGKAFETNGALFAFAASLQINTDRMVDLVGSIQQVDLTA